MLLFSLPRDKCFARLVILCRMMFEERKQIHPDLAVTRQLPSTLITMISSEARRQDGSVDPGGSAQGQIFLQFLHLLEEYFRKSHDVQFYADRLFISTRNLNLLCRQIMQQSVSEIIETRKVMEAKKLLVSTGKTLSKIGYELGYKEKIYFTHAFKKKARQTPTEFRSRMRKLILLPDRWFSFGILYHDTW